MNAWNLIVNQAAANKAETRFDYVVNDRTLKKVNYNKWNEQKTPNTRNGEKP